MKLKFFLIKLRATLIKSNETLLDFFITDKNISFRLNFWDHFFSFLPCLTRIVLGKEAMLKRWLRINIRTAAKSPNANLLSKLVGY